ncbi:hypothetical protein [Mariniplasma anaerobium]|uniref:Uncharacterized protein n=1 Tax=Mariniplasma anaerobium TaxID=2735436 RepID=A0A7U9XVN4_9MOLU|nr:hypothetical protein [Mariniplasma anaerobium]BCR36512.1 hypothetical protein MPAN_014050 [Mariniplasma anaerobium]
MVLKRVYMQNLIFYVLILLLSTWVIKDENNISVLAYWFLPMLYYVFLTTQLNHTRKDSAIIKVLHYIVFILKFALTYITLGLLQSVSLTIALLILGSIVLTISTVEYFLLSGKTQVIRYKDLYLNSMDQVMSDIDLAKEKNKYRNETGLSIFTLGFLIGSIHYLEVPKLEFHDIFINGLVAILAIYLYRRFQVSNKKTFVRIVKHQLMDGLRLKRIYIIGQILLHLSFLATIGIKAIEPPDSITLLMIIPILMNYPLIYLNRVLVKGVLTEQEKEILNVD